MFNVYKNQQSRQTGSRNLMGPKTIPTIWYTRLCWFLYTLNIYAHFSSHFSQQLLMAEIWYLVTSFIYVPHIVGSVFWSVRFLLPVCQRATIWYTYMTLVTKYQIFAINSYWEKCDEKYLGRTDRGKTVYPPPPSGSKIWFWLKLQIVKIKYCSEIFQEFGR
jgi:hypothetical protein